MNSTNRSRPSIFRRFTRYLFGANRAGQRRPLNVLKLEDRRLPDAGFGVVAATLVLNGFDAGDTLSIQTTAPDVHQFTLTDGIWDVAADLPDDIYSLSAGGKTLTVDNSAGTFDHLAVRTGVNDLAAVEDGAAGIQMRSLAVHGADSVRFDSSTNDFGTIIVSAGSAVVNDANDIALRDISVSGFLRITAGGDITSVESSTIDVGGNASLTADNIAIGNQPSDVTNFGSLSIDATGSVEIMEDSDMRLTSSDDILVQSAGSLNLTSAGDLELTNPLEISGSTTLTSAGDMTQSESASLMAASLTIDSAGAVGLNGSTSVSNGVEIKAVGNFIQDGLLTAGSLTVSADGMIGLNNDVTISNAATITALGNIVQDGELSADSLTLSSGGTVMLSGAVDIMNAATITASDDITLDANGSFAAATLEIELRESSSGTVTLSGAVDITNAATITASGDVTQGGTGSFAAATLEIVQQDSSGNVTFDGLNDVDVLAISNTAENGMIAFFDIDDLRIGTVGSTSGLNSNAGDINITSAGNLRVSADINAAHNSSTTPINESITLISRTGDFFLDEGLTISSDEDPTPGMSTDETGDTITIAAGTDSDGAGVVDLGSDVDIRTDGGVARQIAPRPQVFVPMPSAFFEAETARGMRSGLQYVNGEFLGVLDLIFGVAGEENLQLVIDWGVGPQELPMGTAGDAVVSTTHRDAFEFTLADADKAVFRIHEGGERYLVPHLYSVTDLLRDGDARNGRLENLSIIGVRFSVAQHESINIWGRSVADPTGSADPATPRAFQFDSTTETLTDAAGNMIDLTASELALLTSTDTNPLDTLPQQGSPIPFDRSRPTDSGIPEGKAEWEFVTGPPPGLVLIDPPPRPVGDIPPLTAPPEAGIVAEPSVVVDFGKGALTEAALGTQVFLEIRRQFEVDADAVTIVEQISDRSILSSREAFENFVAQHPELQDGTGYEVWLVTETSGQGVQQPIVRFEVTGGRPEPAIEQPPDLTEPLELRELEFEQPPAVDQNRDDAIHDDADSDGNTDATSMISPQNLDNPSSSVTDRSNNALQAHPVESTLIGAALWTQTARWRRRVERTASRSSRSRLSAAARQLRRLTTAGPGSEHL